MSLKMPFFIGIFFAAHFLALSATESPPRNLKWFEAQGKIENYQSSDGSGTRPKLVLFTHHWDMISAALRLEIVKSLRDQLGNNPVLLDADCTDDTTSEYVQLLKSNNLQSLPIIGIHKNNGWEFIDCNAESHRRQDKTNFDWIQHVAELATSKTTN